MIEERRRLAGDVSIDQPYTLWGSIAGNVTVLNGGKVYIRGSVLGGLVTRDGGRVHILGSVMGDVTVEAGAKVIVSGIVGGSALNRGGRLFIQHGAKILGKIKTLDGHTVDRTGFSE